jgi:hypothetical protein
MMIMETKYLKKKLMPTCNNNNSYKTNRNMGKKASMEKKEMTIEMIRRVSCSDSLKFYD